MSYREMMEVLSSTCRMADTPLNISASSDNEYWNTVMKTSEKLGFSVSEAKTAEEKPKVKEQSETTPRRPRYKPRKVEVSQNIEN